MKRLDFIKLGLGLMGLQQWIASCRPPHTIKGSIVGANAATGHLLRDKQIGAPATTIQKKVVIIGGGISGLSAARVLHKNGITDFMLLDLEQKTGGHSTSGENSISAFPWGAHYIPIPNNNLEEYLDFLKEADVITGYNENGLPLYNEKFLCFDPQERLYINGRWQDGLVPHFGVPDNDLKQIADFLARMDRYRHLRGADGKDAFAIPVNLSSQDDEFLKLDTLTMKSWLIENGYSSEYLHRYINYCCRDDFGTPVDKVSAWAGIHYFASRKGKAANAVHSDVLTWPEGNGYLVTQLQKDMHSQIRCNCIALGVEETTAGIRVLYYDVKTKKVNAIEAEQCILAVPQFVAARLLSSTERIEKTMAHFHYAPWMVANLLVSKLEERSGAPLSWDNVLHESNSLGYVEATHEILQQYQPYKNLTYYLPLTDMPVAEARKSAQEKTHAQWVELVMADLEKVHPNIRTATQEMNIMVWGHAMAQPLPGMIHGNIRRDMGASIGNRIHFAHTDLAGISIFEEGFYQGLDAAAKVIQQTAKN